jgi:hypothetical protein
VREALMIPIEQTRLTPAEGGDCQAACIASILECPLEEVPRLPPGEGMSEEAWPVYTRRLEEWLAARNLVEVCFPATGEWRPTGYAILAVKSPRFPGLEHAVVTLNGEIVWDPHPGRELGVGEGTWWSIFAVIDPTRPVGRRAVIASPP